MTRPCAGPQPPGEWSGFAVPIGACDAHVHVFGPYGRFPLAEERSYTPPEAPVGALLAHLDALGLTRGVVVTASVYGTDNASTVDALRAYPDRLRGVAVLGPETGGAELDRLHAAGVRGIRLNLLRQHGAKAYAGGAGLETLRALGGGLAERGWHVQAWLDVADLAELAPALEAFPLDIVVDHMGRMPVERGTGHAGFRLLCDKLRGGRYWCKLSGADRIVADSPEYAAAAPFARALVAANPGRLVWGSDWPHVAYFGADAPPRDAALLDLLADWAAEEGLRHRILVDNPARLYGF